MKRINRQIEKQYEIARQMAVNEMIRLARKVLKEHSHLDEFVIAMGSCFFTTKNISSSGCGNGIVDLREQYMKEDYSYSSKLTFKYFKPLDDFLGEWNDVFKLTGEGIRFRAEGEIITDW
ncbi:MAG: hypothetical protein LBL58_13880 [Tannerellaceae bacterium]|jgi:hypothetical protein|nr:hypothetical protein [Tannerellaceae bacterium]